MPCISLNIRIDLSFLAHDHVSNHSPDGIGNFIMLRK